MDKGEKMLELDHLLNEKNKIEEFVCFYENHSNLPVFLWGRGKGCGWFIKLLDKYKIPVTAIIDKNQGGSVSGIPSVTISQYGETYRESIVVISALAHRKEILADINAMHNPSCHVFVFDSLLEVLQGVTPDQRRVFYGNHKSDMNWLYDVLWDDLSKKTFVQIIKGSVTSDCDCYQEIANKSQYFPQFIIDNLGEKEIFVDVGAYTGDSILEFLDVVGDQYESIYAFEPDKKNFSLCKENHKDERIKLYPYGVGRKKDTLFFSNETGGAYTDEGAHFVREEESEKNAGPIEVVKLDDMIQDKVTYIKMDIEGMELEALKGAEQLIRNNKPKLAISVYHKMEDIIEIPRYIWDLQLGYHLYLRHYWSHNGTDTVLFAL